MRKILLLIVGILFVIIGSVGIIVPLLPTTPFLLLASYCFLRSSPKLYEKMINNKVYGKYVNDYLSNKSIGKKAMWFTLSILWSGIGLSLFLLRGNIGLQLLLILVLLGVTIHVYYIGKRNRTKTKNSEGKTK